MSVKPRESPIMDWLDYRQLPPSAGGFSELFFDYLYNYDRVRQFFPTNFRENSSYESVINRIDGANIERGVLQAVLAEQNSTGSESARTGENIRLLGRAGTYAVVTGQQVGLFGGPLYTLYKAITAVALAQKLNMKFPGRNFVPVFWIEGEDHDFQEMNHVSVLDPENVPVRIEYEAEVIPPPRADSKDVANVLETGRLCSVRMQWPVSEPSTYYEKRGYPRRPEVVVDNRKPFRQIDNSLRGSRVALDSGSVRYEFSSRTKTLVVNEDNAGSYSEIYSQAARRRDGHLVASCLLKITGQSQFQFPTISPRGEEA